MVSTIYFYVAVLCNDGISDDQAAAFPNLQALELNDCSVLEKLPDEISSLWPRLRKLHIIGQRQLHSAFATLPNALHFKDLEDLVIKCTELEVVPDAITECLGLQRLILHTNK